MNNSAGVYNEDKSNKKDVSDEANTADTLWVKNINTSKVSPKSISETTTISKKNISYLLQLDVTKKKLEKADDDMGNLEDEITQIEADIEENINHIRILEEHAYALNIDYQKSSVAFSTDLKYYGLKSEKPVIDNEARTKFLEQKKPEAKEGWWIVLDNLYTLYLNRAKDKAVFDGVNVSITTFSENNTALYEKLTKLNTELWNLSQEYENIRNEWFLKSLETSDSKTSIDDFIADDVITSQFKRLISLLKDKDYMKKFWVKAQKWTVFIGDQETWKTFAAKILASEVGSNMYHIKAHDLFSENIKDPNQMLYWIFSTIIASVQKTQEPCFIFLDEIENIIDSIGQDSISHQNISNTIIKNIKNIQESDLDISIIAALSNKNKIDPRFLKYDLFDNQFFFDLPKIPERKRLFQNYIDKAEKHSWKRIFNFVVFDELAKKTDKFSAKHIKQLVDVCVKEYAYQHREGNPFLIDESFLLSKIEELRMEEKQKSGVAGY